MDIIGLVAEDSGVYTCRAQNAKGQAVSTGTLRCTSKENIYLDTRHPQGKAGLEAVHEAERAYYAKCQRQSSTPEASFPKPLFIIPLPEKFSPGEAQPLHMECHVEPKQDPKLRVDWFFNGKLLDHGSRFKMTNDFGFVSLDLSDVYARDQGVYTCRASNAAGEAQQFTARAKRVWSKTLNTRKAKPAWNRFNVLRIPYCPALAGPMTRKTEKLPFSLRSFRMSPICWRATSPTLRPEIRP